MMKSTLKDCVESLLEIRRRTHGELEPGVAKELDEVITQLQFLLETGSDEVRLGPPLIERTLNALGRLADLLLKIGHITDRYLE